MTKPFTPNQWALLGAMKSDMEILEVALARGADLNAPCELPLGAGSG
jgi:hypothetical protein